MALESSSVILMHSDPLDVVKAFSLSRRVIRTIRQNLGWAFIYNVVCIPLAAGVFSFMGLNFSPMTAALAMGLSSICVVLNSLRLYIKFP